MSDSLVKKLNFSSADKENIFIPIAGILDIEDPVDASENKTPTVASIIKLEEAYEPLL